MKIPTAIQTDWLIPLGTSRAQLVTGGLSSSRVWRLSTNCGPVCLKAWPKRTTDPQRLVEIHHHLDYLSDANVNFIPRVLRTPSGSSWMEDNEHYWEASTWLPGEVDLSGNVSIQRRQSSAQAVAWVHHLWRSRFNSRQISCGLIERIERLRTARPLVSRLSSDVELLKLESTADPSVRGRLAEVSRNTLSHLSQSISRLLLSLEELRSPTVVHFVVRDLQCEHLLYTGDRVTGLVDFGASRIDEPVLDLVRLLGSQSPFNRSHRYETLEFYLNAVVDSDCNRPDAGIYSAPATERAEFLQRYRVLDEASTLLSAIQWLQWLVIQPRAFEVPVPRLLVRWENILARLDHAEW